MASSSKRNPPSGDKPASRHSKAKSLGSARDSTPSPRPVLPPPSNSSLDAQMAGRREGPIPNSDAAKAAAAALKTAEDRKARDARAASRSQENPAAEGGDGGSGGADAPDLPPAETPPVDTDSPSGKETATAQSGTAASVPPAAFYPVPRLHDQSGLYDVGEPVSAFEFVDELLELGFASRTNARIFVSVCADSEVLDEDLASSLQKYHPVFDPLRDDDPLITYGAIDGVLPVGLAPARVTATAVSTTYSLGALFLERFAHLVLAATQILDGLNEFLGNPPQKRFQLGQGESDVVTLH
ncbi:hypothetical protein B0H13DRAFT_2375222 [Mycena leptocephala]|nr:hypothetical protein B0H13DRAFT_2375222 [Mycena leptocephala]